MHSDFLITLYNAALSQVAHCVITWTGGDGRPASRKSFLRSLFLIVAAFIVAITSSIFLKKARTRIAQLCSKCAVQLTCIKVGKIPLMFCQPKTCTEQHVFRPMQNFLVWSQVVAIRHLQCAE